MIVLGEAASPESIVLFQNEIANRNQALWVKLWALEGISNIKKKGGGRLSADQESKAARSISDFLEKQKELPWPIQLRALEALGSLRQGDLPTAASDRRTWPTPPWRSSPTPTPGSRSGPRRPGPWGSCMWPHLRSTTSS